MRIVPPVSRQSFSVPLIAALWLACLPLTAQPVGVSSQPSTQSSGQDAAPSQDTAATTLHLTAVVISSLDGKPVPRVLVTTPDRRLALMTDYEGRFSFDVRHSDPAAASGQTRSIQFLGSLGAMRGSIGGAYGVPLLFQLRRPGYINNTVSLPMPSADAAGQPLVLKIVPAGLLTGHIDPDNGDFPTGIFVQLHRRNVMNGSASWIQGNGAQVNSHGEFRFADLQPGDYKLMSSAHVGPNSTFNPARGASAPDSVTGLTPAFYPNADSLDSAAIVHIGPGQTVTADLTPHATTFYRVTIPLNSSDTVQGASVMLQPDVQGLNLGYNSQTRSVEGYLPPGSYTAEIMTFAPNPAPADPPSRTGGSALVVPSVRSARAVLNRPNTSTAIAQFTVGHSALRTAPVTTAASFEIPVIVHRNFSATHEAEFNLASGNVASSENQQAMPVFVNLQSLESNRGGASLEPTGPDAPADDLKLRNVAEGVYRVNVQSALGGYVAAVSSGATDLLRDPLTVTASGSPFPIEITLRDDAASVTGTIPPTAFSPADTTGSSSSYLAGSVFIMGIPLDRPQSEPVMTAAMAMDPTQPGKFQIPQVPPGRYLFLASHSMLFQELEYRNPDVLRDLTPKGLAVTLSAGEKTSIQIPILPDEVH